MQSRKGKPAKRRSSRVAQRDRKDTGKRVCSKPFKNGSKLLNSAKNYSSVRPAESYPIDISLTLRNGLYVQMVQEGTKALFKNEQEQHAALTDLYPVISAFPKFKDGANWTSSTPVCEVLTHALKRLHDAAAQSGSSTEILKDRGHYKIKCKIPAYTNDYPLLPIGYLPIMNEIDKNLHELILYMVIMLHTKCDFKIWDEACDGFTNERMNEDLHYYEEEDKDFLKARMDVLNYNQGGVAYNYYKKIWRQGGSIKIWKTAYAFYSPKTTLAKKIHNWLGQGLKMIESKKTVHNVSWLPKEYQDEDGLEDYDNEIPIQAKDYMQFVWRANDVVYNITKSDFEAQEQMAGSTPLVFEKILQKPEDAKLGFAPEGFAKYALDFFHTGIEIEKKHRTVLYNPKLLKKALHGQPKKSTLLEILSA